jgi:hypothetical protein
VASQSGAIFAFPPFSICQLGLIVRGVFNCAHGTGIFWFPKTTKLVLSERVLFLEQAVSLHYFLFLFLEWPLCPEIK